MTESSTFTQSVRSRHPIENVVASSTVGSAGTTTLEIHVDEAVDIPATHDVAIATVLGNTPYHTGESRRQVLPVPSVPPGVTCVSPSGYGYHAAGFAQFHVLVLSLPEQLIQDAAENMRAVDDRRLTELPSAPLADPRIAMLCKELHTAGQQSFPTLYADGLVTALSASLLGLTNAGTTDHPPSHRSLSPHLTRRIEFLVESRLHEDLSLDDLAAEVGLSRFHFSRVFRETTGFTPYAYVLQQRINRARQLLLAHPNRMIADVALECGFNSAAHFTRCFKASVGCTPSKYREESS